ncbi:hypothetical protein WJX82_004530 [Trebouxia sp. C0006]
MLRLPIGTQQPEKRFISQPIDDQAEICADTTINRMSAKSKTSSRASFGSAIEGILERPWRSISKTPAACRTPAPSSAWKHTPMEDEQQQTGAEQYGSLGFFGSLCSAPPVTDAAGLDAQDECDDMDVDGYDDFSDDADEQRTPWPAVLPGTGSKSASGSIAAETPPAGSLQQAGSGLHAGQSAYGGGSTGQGTTPWSGASARPQDYSVPRFHEMEVQTGRSLQNSPAPSMADVAVLAQSPLAEQPDDTAQQAVEDENAQPGPEAAAPKHVRKSEAHQRLKEANKQRRSLAGEGLHGEMGVRRSSRDKHAPLEYWRNERKVYNREFRSLPTVHHYATRTPSPSWKFVQDLPHKKKSRLAQKATEAK